MKAIKKIIEFSCNDYGELTIYLEEENKEVEEFLKQKEGNVYCNDTTGKYWMFTDVTENYVIDYHEIEGTGGTEFKATYFKHLFNKLNDK